MKDFIVLSAIVVFFTILTLNYSLEQKNHRMMSQMQISVQTSKERAKQAGCFTEEIVNDLETDISRKCGVDRDEIYFEGTTDIQERGELIYYKVGIDIKSIISGNKFFGISDEDNSMIYWIENYCVSEWVE